MKHATIEQLPEIYQAFTSRKDFFPHIRKDYVERMINAHQCIYTHGVIVTYQKYKKSVRIGDVLIPAGSIMLHQILNTDQFNGKAHKVLKTFYSYVDADVYLSVRSDNKVARTFYKRNGMKAVGKVSWSGGSLPGTVYLHKNDK